MRSTEAEFSLYPDISGHSWISSPNTGSSSSLNINSSPILDTCPSSHLDTDASPPGLNKDENSERPLQGEDIKKEEEEETGEKREEEREEKSFEDLGYLVNVESER